MGKFFFLRPSSSSHHNIIIIITLFVIQLNYPLTTQNSNKILANSEPVVVSLVVVGDGGKKSRDNGNTEKNTRGRKRAIHGCTFFTHAYLWLIYGKQEAFPLLC